MKCSRRISSPSSTTLVSSRTCLLATLLNLASDDQIKRLFEYYDLGKPGLDRSANLNRFMAYIGAFSGLTGLLV